MEVTVKDEKGRDHLTEEDRIYLSVPFPLSKTQNKNRLLAYALNKDGSAKEIAASFYDEANRKMVIVTSPNTKVIIAEKPSESMDFKDTKGHYAEAEIDFVVSRGIMQGIGNKEFSVNGWMDRAMLVTVLGRLAGVDTAAYQNQDFADVKKSHNRFTCN